MVQVCSATRTSCEVRGASILMSHRLLKLVSNSLSREPSRPSPTFTFDLAEVTWAMGSFYALNRKPFDAELLAMRFSPDSFIHAARALGLRIKRRIAIAKLSPMGLHACKIAEIRSAIEALRKGCRTEIGEHGVGLSGGRVVRLKRKCA